MSTGTKRTMNNGQSSENSFSSIPPPVALEKDADSAVGLFQLAQRVSDQDRRIQRMEGRRERETIFTIAYQGYLQAYINRFPNIVNRKELMSAGLVEARTFGLRAVEIHDEIMDALQTKDSTSNE